MRTGVLSVAIWTVGIAALAAFPWLTNNYFIHIASLIGVFTIVAVGMNILVGMTGLVSLGHAGPVRRRRLHERVARHPPRRLVLAVGRRRHRGDRRGGCGAGARGAPGTRHLPGHGHHRLRHHRRAGGARSGRVHGRIHGYLQHPLSGRRRLHVLRALAALPDRGAGRNVPVARQQPATFTLGPGHAGGARELGGGGIARGLALPHGGRWHSP